MPTTLLRPAALSLKNELASHRHSPRHLKRDAILVGITLLTMLCVFLCSALILATMKQDPIFIALVPKKIIQLTFYSFFLLLILSNVVSTIGNIFASENMDLLMRMPVSPLRLYSAKLIETLIETSSMYFVFAFPTALAFCYSLSLGVEFLLIGALISLPFLLIPAGFSFIIATIFVFFSSYLKKYKGLIAFLGLVLFFCIIFWVINLLGNIEIEKGRANAVIQFIGLTGNPSPYWLPSRWAADLLSHYVGQEPLSFSLEYFLLVITAIGSIATGYLVFDYCVFKVRSKIQSLPLDESRSQNEKRKHLLERLYLRLPMNPQTRALVSKDVIFLFRDRSQIFQLAIYLIIISFYIVTFRFIGASLGLKAAGVEAYRATVGAISIIMSGFILTSVLTRLVYPSISLEGKAFWILLVSPLDVLRLVRAKFWCWFPVTTSVSLILIVSSSIAIGLNAAAVFCTSLIAIAYGFGGTGLGVGLGAIYAKFSWEAPTQIASGLGSLVLLLLGLILTALISVPSATLIALANVPKLRAYIGVPGTFTAMTISLFLVFFFNIAIAKWACHEGVKSLERRTAG